MPDAGWGPSGAIGCVERSAKLRKKAPCPSQSLSLCARSGSVKACEQVLELLEGNARWGWRLVLEGIRGEADYQGTEITDLVVLRGSRSPEAVSRKLNSLN